jgi:predicted dehydrogenase
MSATKLRVAFIGAGHHAVWTLYPCLQFFPQLDLRAVCDLDATKAAEAARRFGAPRHYTDYRQMLDAEKLDALFCCGGPALHAAVIGEALAHKLPLFVEKPPAPDAATVKALAAKAGAAPVQVAFMRRFAPTVAWAHATWHRDAGTYAAPPADPAQSSYVYEHPWNTGSINRSTCLQGYVGEMAHFVACLEQHAAPTPNLWDGYRAMQLVEAVNTSIRTCQTVVTD